jgi:hypothetical protein
MSCISPLASEPPHVPNPSSVKSFGFCGGTHLLSRGLLIHRQHLLHQRQLHGTAVTEHAVVGEAGRETLQRLLDDVVLFGKGVVVANQGRCSSTHTFQFQFHGVSSPPVGKNVQQPQLSVPGEVEVPVRQWLDHLEEARAGLGEVNDALCDGGDHGCCWLVSLEERRWFGREVRVVGETGTFDFLRSATTGFSLVNGLTGVEGVVCGTESRGHGPQRSAKKRSEEASSFSSSSLS